jgi:outer membrane protein OmpA-like peptidoglycan-associated protein
MAVRVGALLTGAIVLCGLTSSLNAQVRVLMDDSVTPKQIIMGLMPPDPDLPLPGALPKGLPLRNIERDLAKGPVPGQEKLPTVALEIEFTVNSAELSKRGRVQADTLAAALRAPELQPYRFVLEGHTDNTGSATYNLKLSERRAAAVKAYLVSHDGIVADRLAVVGRGMTDPLDPPKDPANPRNRRVQVRNWGEGG